MNIQIDGIEDLTRDLKKWTDKKKSDFSDETKRTAFRVEQDAKRNVRTDQGDLRASIHTRNDVLSATVYTNKKHAPYEEFGTGKHVKIPAGLEDVASQFRGGGGTWDDLLENIQAWVKRKGIDPEAAYPIAAKIAREGREGKPFLFPAAERFRKDYIKAVKRILKK